jgi:diguanylate cyclase (GGDEF)-like protein
MALTNLRLCESCAASRRDPLDGTFNRRYMEETLAREISQADRRRRPLTVVMLDLDHFKRFNDSSATRPVTRTSRGGRYLATRSGAVTSCRYGGEEFALVLPDTGWEAAVAKVETLLAPSRTPLRCDDRTLGRVAGSAGIACFRNTA